MVTRPGKRGGARDQGPESRSEAAAFHAPHPSPLAHRPSRASGYVLLALLFAIALLGVGMAAMGTVWQMADRREKEAELLFIGEQFRRAIESYYRRSPGTEKQLPRSLADLLQDDRFPRVVRHLRKVYADPLTGQTQWGLVRDERGGILAVHSLSEETPLKTAGFSSRDLAFAEAVTYRDWVFRASVEAQPAQAGSTFVQGPEEDAGTGLELPTKGGETPKPPESAAENRQRLGACEQARQETFQECKTLREQGDMGGWTQCMRAAGQAYQNCLAQR